MPPDPLTVARYLAVRAGSGASIATLRLATSAISKAHEWAKLESPCRDPGVRAALKGWGRRLAKPQRQAGALTADVLAVIRLTAVQPRKRGRGIETAKQAVERGGLTWPWWRRCPTPDSAAPRLHPSRGATCSAGTTAAAASPSSDPRRMSRLRAPQSPSLPPPWRRSPPSGRREPRARTKCSGCRSRRSPGGSRRSPGPRG